jgi:sugar lactone lactonase YvrE
MARSRIRMAALTAAGLVAALGTVAIPTAGALAEQNHQVFTVVADHLNNPRGLSPAPGGGLYLAEAGSGGSSCISAGQETECMGLTGSLDRVSPGGQVQPIVTGLFSAAGAGGTAAEGPVSVSSSPSGAFFALFGLNDTEVPSAGTIPASLRATALAQLGHLWLVRDGGQTWPVSNVGHQDWEWAQAHQSLDPGQFPDSNPNGVLYSRGRVYVADAGTNVLSQVNRSGAVKVLDFFPVPAGSVTDAVPTCVTRGPDGALYVGELINGSFAPGQADVWRIAPGQAPTVWATGLTTVQGCGFGSDGAFYATEFQATGLNFGQGANPAGDVVRIDRQGHRTRLGVGKLFYPSGFAAGPDGAIYVSNCSIAPATGLGPNLCPTGGQVVRIG